VRSRTINVKDEMARFMAEVAPAFDSMPKLSAA
jgi:hypothetical protein